MFNKSTVYLVPSTTQRTYSDTKVTINENKAPTDESVKLLRKMEKAARKEVEKSIRVTDTNFDCNVMVQAAYHNSEYQVVTIYTINGVQRRVMSIIPMHYEKTALYEEIGKTVLNDVAKDIAENVIHNLSHVLANNLATKYGI